MSQKLHILFLCSWYPSKVLPTNGDFIQRHAEAVSLSHRVSVLHIVSDKSISKSQIDSKEINNVLTHIGYVKHSSNPLIKGWRFLKMYRTILKKIEQYDLIHLNVLFPFGLFTLFQKTPYIISEHWTGYHTIASKKISFLEKKLSKYVAKKASSICPVSDDLKKSMQKIGLRGNYIPVPNVVDTELFIPKKYTSQKEFTIVHISNLNNNHKNVSGMLKAAKLLESKITHFSWKFIGGKSDNFETEISELNFNSATIQFIDHLPQKELVLELQKADVFVLFSNYENLPCVILEAFSCGIPVISTDVGGVSEYFSPNFGYLITKNDTKDLVHKLSILHKNPIEKKEEMHKFAIENFSRKSIANQFSTIYFKALNSTF